MNKQLLKSQKHIGRMYRLLMHLAIEHGFRDTWNKTMDELEELHTVLHRDPEVTHLLEDHSYNVKGMKR